MTVISRIEERYAAGRPTPEQADFLRLLREVDPVAAYAAAAKMGLSQAGTAAAFGVTREAVRRAAATYGLTFRAVSTSALSKIAERLVMEGRERGLDNDAIAEATGLSSARVSVIANRIGAPKVRKSRPSARAEQVRALAESGMTIIEVARHLGIPASNVSRVKARYGIAFQRDGRRA